MPYIEAAGARLHVEEHGDGYPIIFVHELGPISGNGKIRFATSRALIVASPTTPAAIRRATFPRIRPPTAGNVQSMTSLPS